MGRWKHDREPWEGGIMEKGNYGKVGLGRTARKGTTRE